MARTDQGWPGGDSHDQFAWHQLTRVVGGVVGLVIIAVVAFAAGGMLADRSVLPVAGERESIRDQALVPSALRLEFVEGTWVRVTTDDQTPASPLYAGDLSRASVSELVGPDADEQHFVGRVGAAESTSNGEWYVCDAEFRCRIDQ